MHEDGVVVKGPHGMAGGTEEVERDGCRITDTCVWSVRGGGRQAGGAEEGASVYVSR